MWGAQREILDFRLARPRSPSSVPRPQERVAVALQRIKVLDVLSFVLLINRQFYEVRVCCRGGPGAAGAG